MIQMSGLYNLNETENVSDENLAAIASATLMPLANVQKSTKLGIFGVFVAQLCTTPEDFCCNQPVISRKTHSVIVLDGSLENREEVAGLASCTQPLSSLGDAQLLLSAYEGCGLEVFPRLSGLFACIIRDEPNKRLVCARDCFGGRPLYYAVYEDCLAFSSWLPALLALPSFAKVIDQEYLADFLAVGGNRFSTRTPFRGIRSLPPGHLLVANAKGLTLRRFYDFELQNFRVINKDEEYEEVFREYFRQSIKAALRCPGVICADLSGGHDSSAIVSAAAHWFPETALDPNRFRTVTLAVGTDGMWAKRVLEQYPFPQEVVNSDDYLPFGSMMRGAPYWNEPDLSLCAFPVAEERSKRLQGMQARVCLCGAGAEAAMINEWPDPVHLADYLRTLQLRTLRRELVTWSRIRQQPWTHLMLEGCIQPLIWRGYCGPSPSWKQVPDWIHPDFVKRTEFHPRIYRQVGRKRFRNATIQYHYELLSRTSMFLIRNGFGLWAEYRFPFLHRPLVEFLLAAPWEQKVRPYQIKSLMRRALRGILPDAVRLNNAKSDNGPYMTLGLNRNWSDIQSLADRSILAELGCIDLPRFRGVLDRARLGYAPQLMRITLALILEAWLEVHLKGIQIPESHSCFVSSSN
jgi:asparagine synthase (glutamine-hydrolysing)